MSDMSKPIKELVGEYAHCYAFVGDNTMPRKQKELYDAIDKLQQESTALKTMVNELKNHLEKANHIRGDINFAKALEWHSFTFHLIDKTPRQSLIDHDKEVIEKILESLDTQVDGWSLNAIKEYINNMEEDENGS